MRYLALRWFSRSGRIFADDMEKVLKHTVIQRVLTTFLVICRHHAVQAWKYRFEGKNLLKGCVGKLEWNANKINGVPKFFCDNRNTQPDHTSSIRASTEGRRVRDIILSGAVFRAFLRNDTPILVTVILVLVIHPF
jgi:hypothetical protein